MPSGVFLFLLRFLSDRVDFSLGQEFGTYFDPHVQHFLHYGTPSLFVLADVPIEYFYFVYTLPTLLSHKPKLKKALVDHA